MREWTLVAFTLLMPASIGTVAVAAAVSILASPDARPFAGNAPFALAACLGLLALLISPLHLGHPLGAWRAVDGVRRSWLSREIVASLLFVASAVALAVLRRGAMRSALTVVAVLAGLVVLVAMSRLYMVPAQPAWNRPLTPVGFGATVLLLGIVLVLATAALDPEPTRALTSWAVILLIVQGVVTSAFVGGLPAEPSAAISAAGSAVAWLAWTRIAAAACAALLLLLPATTGALTAPAVVFLVVVSELAGRFLFYAGIASIRAL